MLPVSMALMHGTLAMHSAIIVIRRAGALHAALMKWGCHDLLGHRERWQRCIAVPK